MTKTITLNFVYVDCIITGINVQEIREVIKINEGLSCVSWLMPRCRRVYSDAAEGCVVSGVTQRLVTHLQPLIVHHPTILEEEEKDIRVVPPQTRVLGEDQRLVPLVKEWGISFGFEGQHPPTWWWSVCPRPPGHESQATLEGGNAKKIIIKKTTIQWILISSSVHTLSEYQPLKTSRLGS